MKKQAFNPYLPCWEYIPDGEPHVFGDRVYVFGSHDRFNGHGFCLNDYVCYSAPVQDLSDWRYEGVILKKTEDPLNKDGKMSMWAPDVCRGADGRYYLYYVFSEAKVISVAVCDTPAGEYKFYGYVQHADGTRLGEGKEDDPQFDPAVLHENGKTYLYSGSCPRTSTRKGSIVVVLAKDMLTITQEAKLVVPSCYASKGTGYEGHEFFEASSIRKVKDKYYFVYSSILCHELCYAISDSPTGDFKYMGTIVSACDVGIDSYKPQNMPVAYLNNNHGGMECINGQWYIFYHRHTNNHCFSRQGCAEPIEIAPDGSIKQVRVSSCGLNGDPLEGKGEYPAYIACHLFRLCDGVCTDAPYLTQDGDDQSAPMQYITNVKDGAVIGFRSFDCKNITKITVKTAGLFSESELEVSLQYDGPAIAKIPLSRCNAWHSFSAPIQLPDGICDLYFRYRGEASISFAGFILE